MNKFSLSVAAFVCAGFLFIGCNKDDNSLDSTDITAIDAKIVNGTDYNTKIDVVKAMIWVDDESSNTSNENKHELASGDYTKGGFELDLPETVENSYLSLIETDDMPDGITVSDSEVKGNSVSFWAYKLGDEVGYFNYISQDSTTYAGFIYVDRNVTIKGSGTDSQYGYKYKYDISLTKGWNITYIKETETNNVYTDEVSSKAPSAAMKWIFNEYNQYYNYHVRSYNLATNKVISNRKPFSLFK
jgi:hypothetical protein